MDRDILKSKHDTLMFWGVVSALALICLFFRFDGTTPDVSWLISMCERIYDGEIAYVDIFETTPPIPTLLYMPGVAISRWTPVSAEAAVNAITFLSVFATLYLSAQILPARIGKLGSSRWLILFPAAVFLFIISNDAFAQREYIAAAFALPIVCVFIHHADKGTWPTVSLRTGAALLAGLSIAIKPPLFAMPGIILAAYYLLTIRNVRFVYSSGLLIAGAIGVTITAASLIAFPAYLDGVTTLMRDVYVPVRLPLMDAANDAFYGVLAVFVCAIIVSLDRKASNASIIMLMTTLGYIFVYFAQAKFFSYHLAPAAMFALIALTLLLWKRAAPLIQDWKNSVPALSIYGVVVIGVSILMHQGFEDNRPRMKNMMWAEYFDNPTAMAISPYIDAGFPISRQVGASWVDRIHSQWVANYTHYSLENMKLSEEEVTRAQRYHAKDIERTRSLIRDKAPDIIFQYVTPRMQWLHEAIVEAQPSPLDQYEVIAEEGVYRIWARRGAISTTVENDTPSDVTAY